MKHQQLSTMPYFDRTWTKWITKNKNKGNMSQKNRKHYYFLTPVRHGNNSLNMINLAVKHFLVSPKTSTPNSYRPSHHLEPHARLDQVRLHPLPKASNPLTCEPPMQERKISKVRDARWYHEVTVGRSRRRRGAAGNPIN